MAVLIMEAAQAPGWFVHIVEDIGAVKLVPGRRMASELTVAEFDVDGEDGIRIRSSSGSILVLHACESDSSRVVQVSCQMETAGSVLNVLASRPGTATPASGAAASSSAIPDWVRDGSEFALEFASAKGVFVGNIPESVKCHAVVGVDTKLGTSPLLLRSHLVRTIRKHSSTTRDPACQPMPGSEGWGPLGDWIKLSQADAPAPAPPTARSSSRADLKIVRARSAVVPASRRSSAGPGLIAKALRRLRGNSADSASAVAAIPHATIGGNIRHMMKLIASTVTDVPMPLSDPTGTRNAMLLTEAQLAHFAMEGFLVLDDVIPQHQLDNALRAINSNLGRFMARMPAAALPRSTAPIATCATSDEHDHCCASLPPSSDHALLSLACETRMWGAINSLIGAGSVVSPHRASVDLCFPQPLSSTPRLSTSSSCAGAVSAAGADDDDDDDAMSHWNIDGMDSGEYGSCSLLGSVMLSDTLMEGAGGLSVFPGSHVVLAQQLRTMGKDWLSSAATRPDLRAVAPTHVKARAGSVVLLHPLLAYASKLNHSSAIGYACFFRLCHVRHDEMRIRLPADPLVLYSAFSKAD